MALFRFLCSRRYGTYVQEQGSLKRAMPTPPLTQQNDLAKANYLAAVGQFQP